MAKQTHSPEQGFTFGSTVVGERGQVVIPKSIRDKVGLKPGSSLMVMQQENGPVVLFPVEHMQKFLDMMGKQLQHIGTKADSQEN